MQDVIEDQEPLSEAFARHSREAAALSSHARCIADWLDGQPDVADNTKLRFQRNDLRSAAHSLDDVSQGLRDLARSTQW